MNNFALLGRGEQDWFAGGNSPINRKVLLENGNWKVNAIPNEIQVVNYGENNQYDSSMCVSFAIATALAYNLMEMLRQGLIPPETARFLKDDGYFVNGYINFSERFIAVKGETKSYGAYMYKVANACKNFGLIPQRMFEMADNFNDNIDPKFITEEHEKQGKKFLEHLAINYEWVNDNDTAEFLKYSSLPCVGQFANYVNPDDILNPPTKKGHCMTQVLETDEYKEVDESYWQQFKKYKKDKLQSFMAFYLTPLKSNIMMDTKKWIKENDLKWVQNSNNGQFGRVLRGKLMIVPSTDRASALLIDDKMRKEPSIKITNEEFEQLKKDDLVVNF